MFAKHRARYQSRSFNIVKTALLSFANLDYDRMTKLAGAASKRLGIGVNVHNFWQLDPNELKDPDVDNYYVGDLVRYPLWLLQI